MAAIAGNQPFIMKPDGLGWLYAPGAVKDGPLPTHYEPVESPVGNLLYPRQTCNPTVRFFEGPLNRLAHTPTAEYPVVATTFRLTEHYLSGPMSRFNSWLNELQPEMFVELSPELAAERGIVHGGWLTVQSARGRIEARAMVTRRLRPLLVEGRVVHQIGIPFHWAFAGEVVGGNANDLTSLVADPNVSMHECKAFACQVQAGRLDGQRAEPDEARGALADARAGPRHAGRRPAGREVWTWQVEKRNWPACPRQPTRPAAGCRRSLERLVGPFRRGAPPKPRPATGFYTDTTVCIGCKACEVACKQWNQLPADGFHWSGNSYDNTGELSATSWRHVKFIEQFPRDGAPTEAAAGRGSPWTSSAQRRPRGQGRWLMMSDVCKHCVTAPCQQACPTGAIIHNEFENVYIQPDICNGCAYCIAACPFGVITRSSFDGHAHKCTLCYDRQRTAWCRPAPRPVRPQSIQFGPIDELRERARKRVEELHRRGVAGRLPVRRRRHRHLFRAEFVLPPGRSSRRCMACRRSPSTRGCT